MKSLRIGPFIAPVLFLLLKKKNYNVKGPSEHSELTWRKSSIVILPGGFPSVEIPYTHSLKRDYPGPTSLFTTTEFVPSVSYMHGAFCVCVCILQRQGSERYASRTRRRNTVVTVAKIPPSQQWPTHPLLSHDSCHLPCICIIEPGLGENRSRLPLTKL